MAIKFDKLTAPKEGTRITYKGNKLQVPDDPVVCYVRGDGIGVDPSGHGSIPLSGLQIFGQS